MNKLIIKAKFDKIGARVKFSELSGTRFNSDPDAVVINIVNDKKGEIFDISTRGKVDLTVPDIRINDRHLLMMAKIPGIDKSEGTRVIKTLCGYDEREFFAAQVPGVRVSNVITAKQALKPDIAIHSQKKHRVRRKNLNHRKNRGFIRQGEWFFVPVENLEVVEARIQLPKGGEPIILAGAQAGNKPHMAQEAYIAGGTRVFMALAPSSSGIGRNDRQKLETGLTASEKSKFIRRFPKAKHWSWRAMTRNPELYVRGRIRHPDHKTIMLRDWHRVAVNTEIRGRNVVFLD